MPTVSPKKSIEGSIGGSLVGTIVCTIFHYNIIGNLINLPVLIIVTLVLTILGQLGDLFFSKIKRETGVKDFSNIMPGHGGVLDRLDSMTFVIIGYAIIVNLLKLHL
jgi:phosphatidate cytidylyltransferase